MNTTNILVPSIPKRLEITQTMIEDFLIDPVMGSKVMLNVDLDVFQRCRLRAFWWTRNCIDSSGVSTGKTLVDVVYAVQRCLLLYDHVALVYYQNFQASKDNFWATFLKLNSPIFMAHIGRIDRLGRDRVKSSLQEPGCLKGFFKNDSLLMLPAPGFLQQSRSQAGKRCNTLLIDEFTKAEATAKSGESGIDKQLIGRCTRRCFNKFHPIWGNHITFTATAEDSLHPSYARVRQYNREIAKGDPDKMLVSYSFKDWSNHPCPHAPGSSWRDVYRFDDAMREIKLAQSRHGYLQEALGIWSREGVGLYTPNLFLRAMENGERRGVTPLDSRAMDHSDGDKFYFLGADPAPAQSKTADDGALLIGRARIDPERLKNVEDARDNPADWQFDLVYARKVRGASLRQQSGIIHDLHRRFSFSKICLDTGPGGGGGLVRGELAMSRQLIEDHELECKPIASPEDTTNMNADFVLTRFWPNDKSLATVWPDACKGIDVLKDYAHASTIAALTHGTIGMPWHGQDKEPHGLWSDSQMDSFRLLANLLPSQCASIRIATSNNGESLLLSSRNARQFITSGHDDFAYAFIMAYTGFLVWLKNSFLWATQSEEDEIGIVVG